MLLIDCPWCGPRNETEFNCGGESHVARPGPADSVSAEEWADYMFFRRNPRGMTFERWRHGYGCGQWFNVARNTLTHRIEKTYRMTEPRPEVA